jgi:Mobilization protein NikA
MRRKPKAQRKEELVRIRLTREQKEMFVNSAADAGLDVSSWLRSLGLQAIRHAPMKIG